ncbi:hypothetical protein Poly51_24440 [Rubripirellula tenax]|uniref:Uncharacterized protein n=1 Tax=Rubripirellula tenax TaxID=2528015 RepID=A0A5C6F459_9BACT|nr:hypothetical protein [Rubripirellula tenax]TWU56533.1 hypothetical protein Poly51_24440 [Rubripirellula tenax]
MNIEILKSCRSPRPRQIDRGGFLYVAVLFTSLIVSILVVTAISNSTQRAKEQSDWVDRGLAVRAAESEMHRLASMMRDSSLWRQEMLSGRFSAWRPWSTGTAIIRGSNREVRHRYVDQDGSLDNDPTHPVDVTVHARVGRSQYAITTTLQWDRQPLSILNYGMTAVQNVHFQDDGSITCERPVQVGENCTESSGGLMVTPLLHCDGTTQMTLRGDLAPDALIQPSRDLVETYQQISGPMARTAIPSGGTGRVIRDRLISATSNPFGPADASGIYHVDMKGEKLVIEHSRIDATLVIESASEIEIRGAVTWSYSAHPDAILVTDSPVRFVAMEPELSEASRAVHFNPTGSGYRGMYGNTTLTDRFPTELRGLIYSQSSIQFEPLVDGSNLIVTGMIVGHSIEIRGNVSVFALDELFSNPPDALCNPVPMRIVRGSWRRIESPAL